MFESSYMTDAIGLLKDDHREVEELIDRYMESVDTNERLELAQTICQLLLMHTHIEEQLFYPALRQAGLDVAQLDSAVVEHDVLTRLIGEIDGEPVQADLFDARIRVLAEYFAHHIEQEENDLMPLARSSGIDLELLGEEILELKHRLEAQVDAFSRLPVAAGRVALLQVDGQGLRQS